MTDKPRPTTDLLKRCVEIHEWRSTGLLSGDALRDYAKRKWPDRLDTLQMAEHETVTEALALLAKWGTPTSVGVEPVAKFDNPMVQAVYAILCEDAEPPKGEHWEGFAARRIVDALSADSVLEDAARYRFLAGHCRSTSEHWGGRWSIVVDGPAPKSHDSEDDFDEAVDAARKQGATNDR